MLYGGYHSAVPQACPACLWISSDAADECERCGQPLAGRIKPQASAGAGLGGLITTGLGLAALGVIGVVLFQRAAGRWPNWEDSLRAAAHGLYAWFLGPNEAYKPVIVALLLISLFMWLVLWLLARSN